MSNTFSNILVPVDFSLNTDIAIQKALWLADPSGATIHLLHIMGLASQATGLVLHGIGFAGQQRPKFFEDRIRLKLDDMQYAIQTARPNIRVVLHVASGDMIQKHIIQYAAGIKPNLVIIGKNKNHDWFSFLKMVNASSISNHTNCPVLTVKPGNIPNKLKTVVIPVSTFVPLRKIELLTTLTRNHRPMVHLVAVDGDDQFAHHPGIFLEAYRTIAECLHYPVIYQIVKGKKAGKALLNYAKSVMADIIMVNPDEESKINSFLGVQINDLILPTSTMSVLTAKPYYKNNLTISKRSMYEENI